MTTTYMRYTLEGEHSAHAAQRMLGDVAQSGLIVRIDVGDGKTHVYIAEHAGGKAATRGDSKPGGDLKGKKVSEGDIARFG
jgi:hypothetical protein